MLHMDVFVSCLHAGNVGSYALCLLLTPVRQLNRIQISEELGLYGLSVPARAIGRILLTPSLNV